MTDNKSPVRIQWQDQTIAFKSAEWHKKNRINAKSHGRDWSHMKGNFYEAMALASIPDSGYKITQTGKCWQLIDPHGMPMTTYFFEESSRKIRTAPINLGWWSTDSVLYPENRYANTDIIWTIKNNKTIPLEHPPSYTGLDDGLWFPNETIKMEVHVKSLGARHSPRGSFCALNTNTNFIVKQLMGEDSMNLIDAMKNLSKKYKVFSKGSDLDWLNKNKQELLSYLLARFSNTHIVMSPSTKCSYGKLGNKRRIGDQWNLEKSPIGNFKSSTFSTELGGLFRDYHGDLRQKIAINFDQNKPNLVSFYKPSPRQDWMLQLHFQGD